MKIGTIKSDTSEAQPHVIPEVEKTKSCHQSGNNQYTQLLHQIKHQEIQPFDQFQKLPKMFPLEETEK